MGTSVLCYSYFFSLSWTILIKFRVMPWCNRSSRPLFFFYFIFIIVFFFFSPPLRLARWLRLNRKKRFHRCIVWPCDRAKSGELLNSRLRFYFRIDKEKMEADLNLLSFSLSLSFSLWTIERKAREEKKKFFSSSLSLSFFLSFFLFFIPMADIS